MGVYKLVGVREESNTRNETNSKRKMVKTLGEKHMVVKQINHIHNKNGPARQASQSGLSVETTQLRRLCYDTPITNGSRCFESCKFARNICHTYNHLTKFMNTSVQVPRPSIQKIAERLKFKLRPKLLREETNKAY